MNVRSHLLVVTALAVSIGLAGCDSGPSSAPTSQAPQAPQTPPMATATAAPKTLAGDFAATAELKNVHFELDQARVRRADARLLEGNARWLKSRREMVILVGGHADERGSDAYNVRLAERRAETVKKYLVAQGVEADRITTTSHGESRPVCADHAEGCWSKNRRAEFQVKPR
ncbi:MAG: OmpA family protein [Candidatus Rokuibacteriota bacterium]